MIDPAESGSADDAVGPTTPALSRRALFGAAGVGLAGLGAGLGYLAGDHSATKSSSGHPASGQPAAFTVSDWLKARGDRYFIAHRGSGDVYPEHSFPAYDAALAWGASAIEVSVHRTSDGELICIHDDTYDRTTNITGPIKNQPADVLKNAVLTGRGLGPAWSGAALQTLLAVPRLEQVLERYGNLVVLCLDAKDPAAYNDVIAMVRRYGLLDSVISKVHADDANLTTAHRLGLPVFGYYGSAVPTDQLGALAKRLDRDRDYLVVTPADDTAQASDIAAVKFAVTTGVTTWAGPLHRRFEVDTYVAAGAAGAIAASYGYLATKTAAAKNDSWAARVISAGELTRSPGQPGLAPKWTGDDALTLDKGGRPQFLAMGNLSPLPTSGFQIEISGRWDTLPADPSNYFSLAFGHTDDRYYEARSGVGTGFHALLRANGSLELFAHRDGEPDGQLLAPAQPTGAVAPGSWFSLRLTVDGDQLRWTRTDGSATTATATGTLQGGYIHVGRSSSDGSLSLRGLLAS
jgi:hypothetical protein